MCNFVVQCDFEGSPVLWGVTIPYREGNRHAVVYRKYNLDWSGDLQSTRCDDLLHKEDSIILKGKDYETH